MSKEKESDAGNRRLERDNTGRDGRITNDDNNSIKKDEGRTTDWVQQGGDGKKK